MKKNKKNELTEEQWKEIADDFGRELDKIKSTSVGAEKEAVSNDTTGIDLNAEHIVIFKKQSAVTKQPRAGSRWTYQLVENQKEPIYEPSWQQIELAVSEIDGTAPHSYAVLIRRTGGFIQACACNGDYHVEIAKVDRRKKTKTLCVIGVVPFRAKTVRISTPKKRITSLENEVLKKTQALKLFRAFWKRKPMPTEFLWRDILPELKKREKNA